jgi:hypothetical protein
MDPEHFRDLVGRIQTLTRPGDSRAVPFEKGLSQPECSEDGFPPHPVRFHYGRLLLCLTVFITMRNPTAQMKYRGSFAGEFSAISSIF